MGSAAGVTSNSYNPGMYNLYLRICIHYMHVCNNNNVFVDNIAMTTPMNPMLLNPPGSLSSMTTTTPISSIGSSAPYDCWNTLSVLQQMQNNTDHLVTHQVEMQEMRKLIHFQQEQYKLTSRLFTPTRY